jgi:large subunit ribosomal protein LP1
MSTTNKSELATSYAALILADESIPITPEKLQALLKAAGIEDVEPIWTTLFAKALEGKDVKELVTEVAAAGGEKEGESGGKEDGGKNGGKEDDGSMARDEDTGSDGDEDEDGDLGLGLFD